MRVEWDPNKNDINIIKHHISFEEAALVFSDKQSLSLYDEDHSDIEDRWITLGQTPSGKIIVVIHTYTKRTSAEKIRLISARKATKREMRQYYEKAEHK